MIGNSSAVRKSEYDVLCVVPKSVEPNSSPQTVIVSTRIVDSNNANIIDSIG